MTALLPPFPARGYRRPWAPPAAAVLLAAAVSSYVTVLRCDNMPLAPCRRCDGQLHPITAAASTVATGMDASAAAAPGWTRGMKRRATWATSCRAEW